MKYEATNFDRLLGLEGFSENALKVHFALYQGYVNNTNKLLEELKTESSDSPQRAELQRRFGWEFNGMRLHECYFGALTKEFHAIDEHSALYKKLEQDFGSYEQWEQEFRAVASARGIGWAILYYDHHADRLLNVWVNEHDQGHLAGSAVILNMDVFEHAFMLDYGTKKADYISAFMKAIDWKEASKRFDAAH